MTAGYNYPNDSVKISALFAPAYLLGSLGMDYKPKDDFSAYISPVTSKITIVADKDLANQGAFGVTPANMMNLMYLSVKGRKSALNWEGTCELNTEKY